MKIEYTIFKERELILSTFPSYVDEKIVINFWEVLKQDPGFEPDYNHLVILTRVSQFNLLRDEMKNLALAHPFSMISRRAVVTSSEYIYRMHKIYEIYQEYHGLNFSVFNSCKEAYFWIKKWKIK